MRYVGYVGGMGKLTMHSFAWETQTVRPFGRPGIERWIILKLILKKQDGRHGLK
jgi:hypothetical protein